MHVMPTQRGVCLAGVVVALSVAPGKSDARGPTETIRVDLELRSGGGLSGLVVDHTAHGLVVMHDTTPYVFAWDEIKTPSAYTAMRDLKRLERGGDLTADDHFQLGLFALARNRNELAAREFGRAGERDASYAHRVRGAFARYRQKRKQQRATRAEQPPLLKDGAVDAIDMAATPGLSERVGVALTGSTASRRATAVPSEIRARVREIYRSFGETVRRTIGPDVALIETDHFLIWTDWTQRRRGALAQWCEAMYAALCEQFALDASETIFLAKCPIFCWRSKARFLRFARQFDSHDGAGAIGYTRSIEKSGHVHIVLLRQGRSEADFDRFACTLVHEGTHAFVHRLYATRLIPHWVNEGYADLVAERVLGDRCRSAENAALLARQYVRFDWPINGLLDTVGPIGVHEYPLAHSVVRFLEGLGTRRWTAFIRSLKAGRTVREALTAHYDRMTPEQLEARWRSAIRTTEKLAEPPVGRRSVPWWPE